MDQNQASYLDFREVAKVLETDLSSGLGLLEAQYRLKKYGLNRLECPTRQHSGDLMRNDSLYLNGDKQLALRRHCLLRPMGLLWDYVSRLLVRLARQLLNPLLQLLILCSGLTYALGNWEQALAILAAVLIVCLIVVYQESCAESSLLASMAASQMVDVATGPSTCNTSRKCRVLRDGHAYEIEPDFLVPGDVVQLDATSEALCRVPADLRLFECQSFLVDESNLMGYRQLEAKVAVPLRQHSTSGLECGYSAVGVGSQWNSGKTKAKLASFSSSAKLSNDPTTASKEKFAHQNLALMGTRVESGSARGLVVATGKCTQYGRVLTKLSKTRRPRRDLRAQVDRLSINLVVWACFAIAIVAILNLLEQREPNLALQQALALFVVAVPEGLPVVAAVMMALGARRLAKKRALVRSLASVETLGTVQVLCLGSLPEELARGDHDDRLRASLRRLRERFSMEVKLISGDSRAQAIALAKRLSLIETPKSGQFQAAPMNLGDLPSDTYQMTPTQAQSDGSDTQRDKLKEAMAADEELGKFVMSGDQLARLLDTDHPDQSVKARELTSRSVFYRLHPQQKAALVRELQHANRVVAVAGNCLHDVLAMKRANLALAMNAGAELCREVADVILSASVGSPGDQEAQDASCEALPLLVAAVAEGRAIHRKLHTFVAFQMSISLTLMVLTGLGLVFDPQGPAPLTPLQLLAINALTEGPSAQLLAMGAPSESELARHWQQSGTAAAAAPTSLSLFTWRLAGAVLLLASSLIGINGPLYVFMLDSTGENSDAEIGDGEQLDQELSGTDEFQLQAQTILFGSSVASTLLIALALKLKFRLFSS